MNAKRNRHTTFLWVELIAFDNQKPDMGVMQYLENLGFIPHSISIFMWGTDFVNQHQDSEQDRIFPPDVGAYMDVFFDGPKKPGPPWHGRQLKQLIHSLHAYGIKVLFSIFPVSLNDKFHREWITGHPELVYDLAPTMSSWRRILNPLKHLNDGTLYEDFLLRKVQEVIGCYGFDGWHLADGFNHSWFQLCHADYSEDMIRQFEDTEKISLLPGQRCADYIWTRLRKPWIDFNHSRWHGFLTKIVRRLHDMGKLVTSNTCWTRDPVEAVYRYGIDYRHYQEIGFDALVVETCSAMGELLDCSSQAHFDIQFFNVIKATSLLTKACAPKARLLFNSCTQDITEGWSSLRHAPAFLEREILAFSNFYLISQNGSPETCFQGLQVCLAADIERHEWAWMSEKWKLGFGTHPVKCQGLALLWDDGIMDAELEDYLRTRRSLTSPILSSLLAQGLALDAVVRIENAGQCRMPLLLINPQLLPQEQRKKLDSLERQTLFSISQDDARVTLSVRSPGQKDFHALLSDSLPPLPENSAGIPEPKTFFHEMFYRKIPQDFYRNATQAIMIMTKPQLDINPTFNLPDASFLRVSGFTLPNGKDRYFFHNIHWRYALGAFRTDKKPRSMDIMNGFRMRPMYWSDRKDGEGKGVQCELRIPPHGTAVIDIEWETQNDACPSHTGRTGEGTPR